MSNLIDYAESELALSGLAGSEDYDGLLYQSVMDLVRKFAEQGHSGASAMLTLDLVDRLLRYQPLTPLTGDDAEWINVSDITGYELWQNRRASTVFKRGDGSVYDIDVVVHYPNDETSSPGDPSEWPAVTFPYLPETTHVYRDEDREDD